MATQTVEFQCVTGQSVTAKLFAVGSDTEVASVSATEATNRKGIYRAAFTDVAAGTYDLIPFASTTPLARWQVVLTLTTATFYAYEPADQSIQAYTLSVLAGAVTGAQTSSETYAIALGGSTYTVTMAGLTSTGTRTAPTLTKT